MWQSRAMAEEQLFSLMCVFQSVIGTNASPPPQASGDLAVIATLALKFLTLSVLLGPEKAPENRLELHTPTPGCRPTECYSLQSNLDSLCPQLVFCSPTLILSLSKAQLSEAHDLMSPFCCMPCGLSSCLARSFWAGLFLIPPSPVPSTEPAHQGSGASAKVNRLP